MRPGTLGGWMRWRDGESKGSEWSGASGWVDFCGSRRVYSDISVPM